MQSLLPQPRKRTKLSPAELEQRNHRKEIRLTLNKIGYTFVNSVSDIEIEFMGRRGDFDDIYLFDNIIMLLEYTISSSGNISTHILRKKLLYDHISNFPSDFLLYLENTFPTFKQKRDSYYNYSQCKIVILYCSKNKINSDIKSQLPNIIFFDYPIVKYFKTVANSIFSSTKYEFFNFLQLKFEEIGKEVIHSVNTYISLNGTVLPESNSNFKNGYKIVSFYIDPKSILEKSYVLRKEGWNENMNLYQRMIVPKKIKAIRKYLLSEERVFVNNIIVTLPYETKLLDVENNTIDPQSLSKTQNIVLQIPNKFNTIGLIDGQHRIYAYYEGGPNEYKISVLREKQNILVTGIIYPKEIPENEKTEFEARLFLEINANQTNAKSDLKQSINLILKPFSPESIARKVLHGLNSSGPLENMFEEYFYEKGKLKTTSFVSFGLKPIVKLGGFDTFYFLWDKANKEDLLIENNLDLLQEYIEFSCKQINIFLSAIKNNIGSDGKWTINSDNSERNISITFLNGIIICLRSVIENNKIGDFNFYNKIFENINSFDFTRYKSSQYGSLARELFLEYF